MRACRTMLWPVLLDDILSPPPATLPIFYSATPCICHGIIRASVAFVSFAIPLICC
eukprot:m.263039 g.263039  ORF g.263039 m.263039 type:complete len:56 (+) comp15597_c0_seq10:2211-2378(+)